MCIELLDKHFLTNSHTHSHTHSLSLTNKVIASGVDAAEVERRAQHMRQQREALIAKKKAARNEKVIMFVCVCVCMYVCVYMRVYACVGGIEIVVGSELELVVVVLLLLDTFLHFL